jgi:hypothetical protein
MIFGMMAEVKALAKDQMIKAFFCGIKKKILMWY